MSKCTVTIEMIIKYTYEIDLEDIAYEFANNDLEDALQTDCTAAFDDPNEWIASLQQCDLKVVGWDRSAEGVNYGNKVMELEDNQQEGRATES